MFDKLLGVRVFLRVTRLTLMIPCDVSAVFRHHNKGGLQHRVSSLSLGFANQSLFKHENEKPHTQRTGLRFGTGSEEALSDLAEGESVADYIGLFSRALHVASSALCVVVWLLPSICLYFVNETGWPEPLFITSSLVRS